MHSEHDPDLQSRGRLMRNLSALREMLPGSFVERRRKCGKPNCRCAQGKPEDLHVEFLLSALSQGKPRTFHIPAALVEEVRRRVELRRRFQLAGDTICAINLGRLLQRKPPKQGREKG